MIEPAILVDRLRVVRGGATVLPELSCEVTVGSVTGLLGPSGSGKSTLIRAIVGVQQVAGGRVEVLGLPAGSAPLRARVGYMTQSPSVYGDGAGNHRRLRRHLREPDPDRTHSLGSAISLFDAGFSAECDEHTSGFTSKVESSRA